MKQFIVLAISITSILFGSCGGNTQSGESASNAGEENSTNKVEITVQKDSYKPAEKDALTVLKAYADEDIETLKSYATGSTKMGLDETYFDEGSNAADFNEKIRNNWKGSFTDIRYYEDEVNFEHYYYAVAVFYESPSGQLTGVALRSTDGENWLMSGFGIKNIKNDEFNALSQTLPE